MCLAVSQHLIRVLDPGVRRELPVDELYTDSDHAITHLARLEHTVEGDGAHEAEWAKDAERGRAIHGERERLRLIETGRRRGRIAPLT